MSGGFFRGTSADQDTRFSNKQAKLMKSQKFAPELDHLVDITKVQMDVVKPWIATKVTELLGFEDEVLINFIYGLLDGKVINGKAVQIQITGFMEKNTGKFMKELWGLLLSAQSNTSGVPQKFLDDKEEEIRKKKVESDRITHEIQKKKESEQEKAREMDGVVDVSRDVDGAAKHNAKHFSPRDPGLQADEEKEYDERNGFRGKSRISRSPHAAKRSPSAERMRRSRSISKSPSNSRNHSGPESASMSRSPQSRANSISPRRRYPSPRKRSMSPRNKLSPRRPRSPIRRRSPRLRRRSSSDSWVRSPSPRRRRSPTPVRRRPSPRRRRSPSPVQRRSPSARRRRSPSPFRRRSPFPRRRRSPSPVRRRSPHMRRRSPLHRRSPSPMRRRSPAPIRRRSPSPLRRRSPTPLRRRSPFSPHRRYPSPSRRRSTTPPRRRSPSPVTRRSPPPRSPRQRRRSPLRSPIQRSRSPYRSHSPAYRGRRSLSRDHDIVSNGVGAKGYGERTLDEMSPVHEVPEREEVSPSGQGLRGLDSMVRRPPISLRSPQHEPRDRSDARPEVPLSLEEKSPSRSDSSPLARKSSPSEDRSLSGSPIRKTRDRVAPVDSPSPNRETRNRVTRRYSPEKDVPRYPRGYGGQRNDSPLRRIRDSPKAVSHRNVPVKEPHHGQYPSVAERRSSEAPRRGDHKNISRNDRDKRSQKAFMKTERPVSPRQSPQREESEFGHGRTGGTKFSPDYISDEHPSAKRSKSPSSRKTQKAYPDEHYGVDEKKRSRSHNAVNSGVIEDSAQMPMRKGDFNKRTLHIEADFMENEKNQPGDIETRKHKRLERREVASDDSESDNSLIDERKEAKRRKKEEKRMRKEERRRRRHERHRRREERRASKHKAKSMDTVTPPSDIERHHSDDDNSDVASKRDSRPSDTEGTESMQKKLEIELRKKALESLRAKKAINS